MDTWNLIGGASAALIGGKDINYSKILAAKKALELLADNSDVLIKLCLAASDGDNMLVKGIASEHADMINNPDNQGLTPLIYAVCFDKKECVQILLNLRADPNIPDKIVGMTPLMWATYLNHQAIVTELISSDADPYYKSSKTGQCAVDIALPGTPMYDYYRSHNLLKNKLATNTGNLFYKEDVTAPIADDNDFDAQLRLQTTGLAGLQVEDTYTSDNPLYQSSSFVDESKGFQDDFVPTEEFNFNILLPKQYIKFHDSSISHVIEYVFDLRIKRHTKPIYPAAIIYQCMRYASAKLQAPEMSKSILDLFLARVRSVTDTKSGVVQLHDCSKVDILMVGYWISAINYLYYFLYRDGACNFYQENPNMLQEIILCLQTLITQFSFALDNKLDVLIDDCLLNFDSVPDLNVVYKTDWKLFQKKISPKSSYEEILDMLYPPSIEKQLKPSPIKIIQTLGAMVYVMDLYHVNDVIKQEVFSSVLYWLGASLFNRVLANKKYSSRSKAMQIRLNLSAVEDWLRINNFVPYKTTDSAFEFELFPDSIVRNQIRLRNVTRFEEKDSGPSTSGFYYNPLLTIGKYHLQPVIELLQWLQVMTSLGDVDTLKITIPSFSTLNVAQLLRTIKNYKYEVKEEKFPKESKNYLKLQVNQSAYRTVYYTDDNKDFLSVSTVFPVVLPNLVELLNQYGANIDSRYDVKRAYIYQPHIPLDIVDDIDDIYDQHAADYDTELRQDEIDDEDIPDDDEEYEKPNHIPKHDTDTFRGTELFKELTMPTTVARKTWDNDEDANPWA